MLWQLGTQHKAAVFELGMNHPGEIAYLAELARPTVALVNNAQREHQEFMQSVEATAYENGEVIAALAAVDRGCGGVSGRRSVRADLAQARRARGASSTSRSRRYAVVTATYELTADGAQVSMATPAGVIEATLAVTGVHNVRNALAATACALAIGVAPRAISAGLAALPAGQRTRRAAAHAAKAHC